MCRLRQAQSRLYSVIVGLPCISGTHGLIVEELPVASTVFLHCGCSLLGFRWTQGVSSTQHLSLHLLQVLVHHAKVLLAEPFCLFHLLVEVQSDLAQVGETAFCV